MVAMLEPRAAVDLLRRGSWRVVFSVVCVYSVFAFSRETIQRGARVFSPANSRSPTAIVAIHIAFLGLLVAAL